MIEKKEHRAAMKIWQDLVMPMFSDFIKQDDRQLLQYRYVDGLTYEEIGEKYNLSPERIRQKIMKACVYFQYDYFLFKAREMALAEFNATDSRAPRVKEILSRQGRDSFKPQSYTPIEILNLSPRTFNALINASVGSIEQLCDKRISDLPSIRGIGEYAIQEIVEALYMKGKKLKEEDYHLVPVPMETP